MTKSIVAAVRTKPETILQNVSRVMELGGYKKALDPSAKTILKDNITWHLFFPAANTTPWQLEGVIRTLKDGGYNDLLAVHNETVVTRSEKGERLNRLQPVFDNYNIQQAHTFKDGELHWERYPLRDDMPALRHVFGESILLPGEFFGANIIHLPTIKTHIWTTITGAMKNAFGGLLNNKRHYTHTYIHRTLVDLLKIQKDIHAGLFAVLDGTHAGNGPGPRTMKPVEKNILLASEDQVAVDAVAAKLMGFDPLKIDFIRMAHQEGLGIGDVRDIELVGDDVTRENWHFEVGRNLVKQGGGVLWFGPLKGIQKLFFHTPLVSLFVLASYIYHDYVWYPFNSRPVLDAFSDTGWGKLFNGRYLNSEVLSKAIKSQ